MTNSVRGLLTTSLVHLLVSDFLNRDYVEKFVVSYDRESHEAGNWFWYKQNRAIQYFNLLALSVWWEKFVKQGNQFF